MHGPRYADASWVGELLQARRDVDAVAVQPLPLDRDVAQVDADAELHPPLGRQVGVASLQHLLDLDGRAHGAQSCRELRQEGVPGEIDEPPCALLHEQLDLLAVGGDGVDGRVRVRGDEARVAGHVRDQDRGESAFKAVRIHGKAPGPGSAPPGWGSQDPST